MTPVKVVLSQRPVVQLIVKQHTRRSLRGASAEALVCRK